MKIERHIVIPAPQKLVWSVLNTLDAYGDWNPFIPEIQGEVRKRKFMRYSLFARGTSRRKKARVVQSVPPKKIVLLASGFIFGILDEAYSIHIKTISANECSVIQEVKLSGVMVVMKREYLKKFYEEGFESMNNALFHRVLEFK